MPDQQWTDLPPVQRGAFGVFQRAAQGRRDTAGIWDDIQSYAETQGLKDLARAGNTAPSPDELAAASGRYRAGWTIQRVNVLRRIAGVWNRARLALSRLAPHQEPTAEAIFHPPWASAEEIPGVLPTYRLRTRLAFAPVSDLSKVTYQWVTTFHEGPLGPVSNLLFGTTMQAIADRYRMGAATTGGGPVVVNPTEYSLELA